MSEEVENWRVADLWALANHLRGAHRDRDTPDPSGCSECFSLLRRGDDNVRSRRRSRRIDSHDFYTRLGIGDEYRGRLMDWERELLEASDPPAKDPFTWNEMRDGDGPPA